MNTPTTAAASDVQPFALHSLGELFAAPKDNTKYLVDDLLPMGGTSVIVAKPKCGKSTLVRQLAVAVAKGLPFLGRTTEQGRVLYLCIEDKWEEVCDHFKLLGADNDTPISPVFEWNVGPDGIERLTRTLSASPDIKLAIIDPIFRFIRVADSNDYVKVTDALAPLHNLARAHEGLHIALVHHMKKKAGDDPFDGTLGSTAINSNVDTIVNLRRNREGLRTIQSCNRHGRDLPESFLVWNEVTHSVSLGPTAEEAERQAAISIRQRIEKEMIEFVAAHHGATQADVYANASGKTKARRDALAALVEGGILVQAGAGVKNDPHTYTVPAIPQEKVN